MVANCGPFGATDDAYVFDGQDGEEQVLVGLCNWKQSVRSSSLARLSLFLSLSSRGSPRLPLADMSISGHGET